MHSEEECSAASEFKEPRSRPTSRAGSADSYAGGRSTNGYFTPRILSPAPSIRYGSSARGSPALSTRYGSSERGSSPDLVYNTGIRPADCRTFRHVNDSRGYRLIMEHTSSCGKPTEVVELGRCELRTRGRPLSPRSQSSASTLAGSRPGSPADTRPFSVRLAELGLSEPGAPSGSRATDPFDTRPISVQLAKKNYSSI
jgi:hypothetical protein